MSISDSSVPDGRRAGLHVPIDAHGEQVMPWSQAQRGGTREDRMLSQVTVSLPPKIGVFVPHVPSPLVTQTEQALAALTRLDSHHREHLTPLSVLLLRAESVASSKIEHVEASAEDFARASHGVRSNPSATSMVASANALESLISSVGDKRPITLANILTAHQILMADDPHEAKYAGRVRDMQNWIGGSDFSPRNALYVPPPPETVAGYLADLLEFANRDDVPALAQAAIAHAQFESIHPFTDGNGRIGRALINTILRRRGVTTSVVVPLASVLVARKDAYFDVLNAYREGDAGPIIRAFARSASISAIEAETSAENLAQLPNLWMESYVQKIGSKPRAGSATLKILDVLPNSPFFTSEDMELRLGGSTSSIYEAINRLAEAGILRPLTSRKRSQVWCAGAVIDELEDLGVRIANRATTDSTWREIQSQVISDLAHQDHDRWARYSRLIAQLEHAPAMQETIDAIRHSDFALSDLAGAIRIPETAFASLETVSMSPALRDVLRASRFLEPASAKIAGSAAYSDSLRTALSLFSDMSNQLARSVTLPESVFESLKIRLGRGLWEDEDIISDPVGEASAPELSDGEETS